MNIIDQIRTQPTPLSKEQEKIVFAPLEHIKVIAGAGAGKTETLTRRIAYLLLVHNVKPSEIVAFTFTEKATQAMKERIYQRVGLIAGPQKTTTLGEMYIGTIHSFAKRILDDYFGYGNYDVLDENQEIAFLMRHGWNMNLRDFENNYTEACREFLKAVDMTWDEMLSMDQLRLKAPKFHGKMLEYETLLDKHKLLTFGRMMFLAAEKANKEPTKLNQIKYLLVDEYQDINPAQALLIQTIGKFAKIFIVGDPRQCIYQWRGSSDKFFEKFTDFFPSALERSLNENRRSAKVIVENANKFAKIFEHTISDEMITVRKKDTGFFGIAALETPKDEAIWLANQIEVLQKKYKLAWSDIGVLMRSVTTSAKPLLDELRRRNIPAVVGGKVGLFKRDEAQALGRIFAWFHDQGFWVKDQWSWGDQIRGDDLITSALELWEGLLGDRASDTAQEELSKIRANIFINPSQYNNFTEIFHDVLMALGFQTLDHEDNNDATMMANLGRFGEVLTDYETANRIGGRTPKWYTDLKGLCWYLNSYASQSYEEHIVEDMRGIPAVQVSTIHQAKGLEWPVVFLISTVDGRFPSKWVGSQQNWCGIPRDMFDVARYEGSHEDERRLFYVAITRPKEALIVSYFKRITKKFYPSPFIQAMNINTAINLGGKDTIPKIEVKKTADEEEILTFSAGELISYQMCPYQYLLHDVWGYQPGLHIKLGYGKSLHHCLRRASELVKNSKLKPLSAVATAVDEGFHMPFLGGNMFDDAKNTAKKTLLEFAKIHENDFGRIQEVEYRLEFPIQGATVTGRVDVILKDGGDLEVREYKTSEESMSDQEAETQVQLYALGLRSMERPIKTGSIAYLDSEKSTIPIKAFIIDEPNKAFGITCYGLDYFFYIFYLSHRMITFNHYGV